MFGERCLKTPLFGMGYAPNDILLMERAVCLLLFEERELIIQRWQRKRTYRQIGAHVGCDHTTAMRRLKRAENDLGTLFAMLHQIG
jgi:DNA-directed RNA polymerase specialized sigma24 family protein